MDAESTIYTKAAHRKKESRLNIGPWWCEGNVNDDGSDDEDLFSPSVPPTIPSNSPRFLRLRISPFFSNCPAAVRQEDMYSRQFFIHEKKEPRSKSLQEGKKVETIKKVKNLWKTLHRKAFVQF